MCQLPPLSDLSRLSYAEKDALIIALWTRVNEGLARVEELTARVSNALSAPGPPSPDPALALKWDIYIDRILKF